MYRQQMYVSNTASGGDTPSGATIVSLINGQLGQTTWQSGGSGTPAWGAISGTLSAQTDLQGALDDKSDVGHDHDGVYAAAAHNHDSAYAALAHDHSGTYAPVAHNHDGSYALISHNHDGSYAASSHAHSISDVTGLQSALDGKIPSGSLISSGANNTITADPKFWSGTQANYDAIVTKDSNTFYFIEA